MQKILKKHSIPYLFWVRNKANLLFNIINPLNGIWIEGRKYRADALARNTGRASALSLEKGNMHFGEAINSLRVCSTENSNSRYNENKSSWLWGPSIFVSSLTNGESILRNSLVKNLSILRSEDPRPSLYPTSSSSNNNNKRCVLVSRPKGEDEKKESKTSSEVFDKVPSGIGQNVDKIGLNRQDVIKAKEEHSIKSSCIPLKRVRASFGARTLVSKGALVLRNSLVKNLRVGDKWKSKEYKEDYMKRQENLKRVLESLKIGDNIRRLKIKIEDEEEVSELTIKRSYKIHRKNTEESLKLALKDLYFDEWIKKYIKYKKGVGNKRSNRKWRTSPKIMESLLKYIGYRTKSYKDYSQFQFKKINGWGEKLSVRMIKELNYIIETENWKLLTYLTFPSHIIRYYTENINLFHNNNLTVGQIYKSKKDLEKELEILLKNETEILKRFYERMVITKYFDKVPDNIFRANLKKKKLKSSKNRLEKIDNNIAKMKKKDSKKLELIKYDWNNKDINELNKIVYNKVKNMDKRGCLENRGYSLKSLMTFGLQLLEYEKGEELLEIPIYTNVLNSEKKLSQVRGFVLSDRNIPSRKYPKRTKDMSDSFFENLEYEYLAVEYAKYGQRTINFILNRGLAIYSKVIGFVGIALEKYLSDSYINMHSVPDNLNNMVYPETGLGRMPYPFQGLGRMPYSKGSIQCLNAYSLIGMNNKILTRKEPFYLAFTGNNSKVFHRLSTGLNNRGLGKREYSTNYKNTTSPTNKFKQEKTSHFGGKDINVWDIKDKNAKINKIVKTTGYVKKANIKTHNIETQWEPLYKQKDENLKKNIVDKLIKGRENLKIQTRTMIKKKTILDLINTQHLKLQNKISTDFETKIQLINQMNKIRKTLKTQPIKNNSLLFKKKGIYIQEEKLNWIKEIKYYKFRNSALVLRKKILKNYTNSEDKILSKRIYINRINSKLKGKEPLFTILSSLNMKTNNRLSSVKGNPTLHIQGFRQELTSSNKNGQKLSKNSLKKRIKLWKNILDKKDIIQKGEKLSEKKILNLLIKDTKGEINIKEKLALKETKKLKIRLEKIKIKLIKNKKEAGVSEIMKNIKKYLKLLKINTWEDLNNEIKNLEKNVIKLKEKIKKRKIYLFKLWKRLHKLTNKEYKIYKLKNWKGKRVNKAKNLVMNKPLIKSRYPLGEKKELVITENLNKTFYNKEDKEGILFWLYDKKEGTWIDTIKDTGYSKKIALVPALGKRPKNIIRLEWERRTSWSRELEEFNVKRKSENSKLYCNVYKDGIIETKVIKKKSTDEWGTHLRSEFHSDEWGSHPRSERSSDECPRSEFHSDNEYLLFNKKESDYNLYEWTISPIGKPNNKIQKWKLDTKIDKNFNIDTKIDKRKERKREKRNEGKLNTNWENVRKTENSLSRLILDPETVEDLRNNDTHTQKKLITKKKLINYHTLATNRIKKKHLRLEITGRLKGRRRAKRFILKHGKLAFSQATAPLELSTGILKTKHGVLNIKVYMA